jgi:G:T/U-mismatch repair DNA glycosylase
MGSKAQKNLQAKIIELEDLIHLNEIGEFEGTPAAASKLYSDLNRLINRYEDKYGNAGAFKKGGVVKSFSTGGTVKRSGTKFKGTF